jgi:hypothetical protein
MKKTYSKQLKFSLIVLLLLSTQTYSFIEQPDPESTEEEMMAIDNVVRLNQKQKVDQDTMDRLDEEDKVYNEFMNKKRKRKNKIRSTRRTRKKHGRMLNNMARTMNTKSIGAYERRKKREKMKQKKIDMVKKSIARMKMMREKIHMQIMQEKMKIQNFLKSKKGMRLAKSHQELEFPADLTI